MPEPADAFPIVGRALAKRGMLSPLISPVAFRKLRVAAEAKARAEHPGEGVEIALEAIYEQIPGGLVLGSTPTQLAEAELRAEQELLVPDLDMLELVRTAREAGKLVVAVSDTYLSEPRLRSLLDPWFEGAAAIDRVFASNEHGTGKTERLFEIVLRELGREPLELLHVGDNELADVRSPERLGIRTLLFERRPRQVAEALKRERHYADPDELGDRGDLGLAAARSKVLHRRELAVLPEELRPYWRYGAAHLGPSLTGLAEYVHERARDIGVSKAFCLMREGELLARMVNAAAPYVGSDVVAEPLWVSRQVCARASIFEGTEPELRALLSRRRPPTVRELCATLAVDVEASPLLLRHADARMNEAALADEVFAELHSNPDLRVPMVGEARRLRERVLAYVRSKLPEGETDLLLVDLGWGGTIQTLLQRILHRERVGVLTRGVYLITHDLAVARLIEGVEIDGYLASAAVPGPPVRAIMRSPEILEQACMPDVGSQVDLDADLQPVLGPPADADLVQSAERNAVQKGVLAFQREWSRYGTALRRSAPSLADREARPLLLASLARALVSPTAEEAAAFGRWIHDENFGSEAVETIAGGAGAARALRYMGPEELIALPMSELYWPFGLATMADERLAGAAEAVAMERLPADAFSSVVETGDFEVYYDNGFGFGESWKKAVESRRNRFGLSYARAELHADEVRGVRLDPVKAPAVVRLDWIALTCFVRGEPDPRRFTFETAEELERLTMRGLQPVAPKLMLSPGDDPQIEIDLAALTGGTPPYWVLVECGYAVMPAAPPAADVRARELQRRAEARSRAAKRFVRRIENRTGLPVGEPLRRGWRALRGRVRRSPA